MAAIGQSLADQFERAWWLTRQVISAFDDEQWRREAVPGTAPARWAYHLVETADFYRRPAPDGFPWGERFSADWEDAPAGRLPSRGQVLAYLDEVEARLDEWLREAPDAELLGESRFPWCGHSVLERLIYLLRHTHQHLGELNMLLRQAGAPVREWR